MLRIAVIKLSSLGDIIHALPVIQDIHKHYPEAVIDWVSEDSYAPLVSLHPGIHRVLTVKIRTWRRQWWKKSTFIEKNKCWQVLGKLEYDHIIDLHGLAKSAWVMSKMRLRNNGMKHGFNRHSIREKLALFAYTHYHPVAPQMNAVERCRQLAGLALDYSIEEKPDYGLVPPPFHTLKTLTLPPYQYVLVIPITSDPNKLWDESYWVALLEYLQAEGFSCLMPHGNEAEYERVLRIQSALKPSSGSSLYPHTSIQILPELSLPDLASVIQTAKAVIGLDTGLTHLAAALSIPTIGIYCASKPSRTGLVGQEVRNLGDQGKAPSVKDVLLQLKTLSPFQSISLQAPT